MARNKPDRRKPLQNIIRADLSGADLRNAFLRRSFLPVHGDLIKRLNAARKKRNFVAHNAISQYVRHLEKNPPLAQSILEGLNETETEGNALVGELWNELNKLQTTSSALPPLPPEFFVHLTLEGTIPRGFYSELDQPRHIDSCTLYD